MNSKMPPTSSLINSNTTASVPSVTGATRFTPVSPAPPKTTVSALPPSSAASALHPSLASIFAATHGTSLKPPTATSSALEQAIKLQQEMNAKLAQQQVQQAVQQQIVQQQIQPATTTATASIPATATKKRSPKSAAATAAAPLGPLRALSAYNFFFRDERDRILTDKEHDWSLSKQEKLLTEHWSRDRTKKRRHRKTHGKIDFTTLSKLISTRWKALPDHRKEFYREIAARDWDRYQDELSKYKAQAAATTASSKASASVAGNNNNAPATAAFNNAFVQVTG